MFAMLTGNLPFTVEPFTIKALHNKMLAGDMNPIPDHLSNNCKELLRQFLTADPEKRINLQEAMQHSWITDGRNKPIEAVRYPNRLTAVDLNQTVLKHMATQLDFKLGEVLRQVTANFPSSATATYHLLFRKLKRFRDGVAKGSIRAGATTRSDTATIGLGKTQGKTNHGQQEEFQPTKAPTSTAREDSVDEIPKTEPAPIVTSPSSRPHLPDPSQEPADQCFTLPAVPSRARLSPQRSVGTSSAKGGIAEAEIRSRAGETPAVLRVLPRPHESPVGRRDVSGITRREMVAESISGDEATQEREEEVETKEYIEDNGLTKKKLNTSTENDVGTREHTTTNNNNNSDDDTDDANNQEQRPRLATQPQLDSKVGQANYRHLANDASTSSSPVTECRTTSIENKENKLKPLSKNVQPIIINRKGSNSRNHADVKFNQLGQINTHASVPPHITEEALFDLSPQLKGQCNESRVGREPSMRPIPDLPQISGATSRYITNAHTSTNQRTRIGPRRWEGGTTAATTSRQPSSTVTGSRSTPSGCCGRSSRGSDAPPNLFLAPLVKAEVTSVPVRATARRHVIDVDHYERQASQDRRTVFFTPRPHQWKANQVKPLTVNPPGAFMAERRRTTMAGSRTASTEDDAAVERGRGRMGTRQRERANRQSLGRDDRDWSGVEGDTEQFLR